MFPCRIVVKALAASYCHLPLETISVEGKYELTGMRNLVLQTWALFSLLLGIAANIRYNQKIYTHVKAIKFADPMKYGFRIIFHDEFLKSTLAPTLLPTLYITAIPLKKDETTVTKMFYPDTIYEDKQVAINDLKEKSWYIVCIEWENISRHNETTGSDCKLFRTLDRMGKSADSTLGDIGIPETESQSIAYRFRVHAEFPIRYTIGLSGGSGPTPPSHVFMVTQPSDLEGMFTYLRQYTNYGKLCITEEPLTTGYSAMGRFVSSPYVHKCYFGDLTTKDYDIQTYDSEALARSASTFSKLLSLIILPVLLLLK
ncbi:unnamed protein product, partial [Mesorhabditis spiculigera]